MQAINMRWRLRYFSWRREWLSVTAIAATLAILYGLSMPPGITFEDAGVIATTCYRGGVLHPPGYPFYTLLCSAFVGGVSWLPINPAAASAWFSAVCAIAACVLFYEIARRAGVAAFVAAAAAITLGAGARFWSQAIIPEVYTLNALLVAATLVLILRLLRHHRRRNFLYLSLCVGLGLANHWPLYVVNGPAFVLLLSYGWRHLWGRWRLLLGGVVLLMVGVSLYFYLWWQPLVFDTISLFTPPGPRWEELWAYITREIYTSRQTLSPSWSQCLMGAVWGGQLLAQEYTWLGMGLALAGAILWYRHHSRWWLAAVLMGVAGSAPLLYGYLCLDVTSDVRRTVLAAYPLPSMIFLMWLISECLRHLRVFARPAAVLLAACVIFINWSHNNRSEDYLAQNYAEAVLSSLPPDAVLLSTSDFEFPIQYAHYALNIRPDIQMIEDAKQWQEMAGRKFYLVNQSDIGYVNDWGLIREWQKSQDSAPTFESPPPPLLAFYRQLLSQYAALDSNKEWDKRFVQRALFSAAHGLTITKENLDDDGLQLLADLTKTPEGLYGQLSARLSGPAGTITEVEIRRTLDILRHSWERFPISWRAQILHREGILDFTVGNRRGAAQKWRQSLLLERALDNPALIDFLHLLAAQQQWTQYHQWRKLYQLVDNPALDNTDSECRQVILECGK